MKKLITYFVFLLSCLSLLFVSGCGSKEDNGNVFARFEFKNPKDLALDALARGDYDTAIDELEKYLKDNPNDTAARAMLANAFLKKAGIDLLKIGSSITDAQSSAKNDFTAILNSMPDGSDANLATLGNAVAALKAIPESQRTPEQNYQLAIAQASFGVTYVKKTAVDENGNISQDKLDTMTDDEANTVYESLAGTQTALAAAGTGDSSGGSASLGKVVTDIDGQPGASSAEKTKAFIASKK